MASLAHTLRRLRPRWRATAAAIALTAAAAVCSAPDTAARGRFGWGVDTGTSIDVSGHDMSTFNIDAYFGYTGPYVDIAGVGASVHMMVSNSSRAFPLYAIVRSSFARAPRLLYAEVRGGVALDNMEAGPTRTMLWLNPSIGINLARSARFCSYISVGYCLNDLKWYGTEPDNIYPLRGGLHYFNVRLGIRF